MANLPDSLNLISHSLTSLFNNLIVSYRNDKSNRFCADEQGLRQKLIKYINYLFISIFQPCNVCVYKIQRFISFEVWNERLRLIGIMTNCKFTVEELKFISLLNYYCVRLLLVFFNISMLISYLNLVCLLFKAEVVGTVNKRCQHGTFATSCVANRKDDVLAFGLIKLGQCCLEHF